MIIVKDGWWIVKYNRNVEAGIQIFVWFYKAVSKRNYRYILISTTKPETIDTSGMLSTTLLYQYFQEWQRLSSKFSAIGDNLVIKKEDYHDDALGTLPRRSRKNKILIRVHS